MMETNPSPDQLLPTTPLVEISSDEKQEPSDPTSLELQVRSDEKKFSLDEAVSRGWVERLTSENYPELNNLGPIERAALLKNAIYQRIGGLQHELNILPKNEFVSFGMVSVNPQRELIIKEINYWQRRMGEASQIQTQARLAFMEIPNNETK